MKSLWVLTILAVCMAEKLQLTVEELEQYDGRNGKIYLACSGIVFDVSDSPTYQPKGSYSNFAGKDVTVALAKYSFDKKWMTMKVEDADLTEAQLKSVEGWKEFFTEKYPIVGEIIASREKEDI